MREISTVAIQHELVNAILKAQYEIDPGIKAGVESCAARETSLTAKNVLGQLAENYEIAATERLAICQDTGMCIVFADIGQDTHIYGDGFEDCVNNAVKEAYSGLRKSVVRDPLYNRQNTGDNTPAVIHTRIVPGDKLHLKVVCKGFGSENMSKIKMLVPANGEQGVIDFVLDTVKQAGANPCPPIILGVCIGGSFEQCALTAKLMTARPFGEKNPDERYARLESVLLEKINALNIGPAGFGGNTTALSVNIAALPTHIASMPVAVNICCHASRHKEVII